MTEQPTFPVNALDEAEMKQLIPAKIQQLEQEMLNLDTKLKNVDGMILAYRSLLTEIEGREAARTAEEVPVGEPAS